MIRVLLFDIGKDFGGTETYILQLINNMNDNVKYCLCVRKGSKLESFIKENTKIVEYFSFDFQKPISSIIQLRKFIKHNEIDCMHCNGINSLIIAQIVDHSICTKSIATIHGDSEMDRMNKSKIIKKIMSNLEVLSSKSFFKYITVSNDLKKRLVSRGVNPSKIEVIHNGIQIQDHMIFKSQYNSFNVNEARIISIGRLEAVKNYELLIKSIKQLKDLFDIDVSCDIYGEGSKKADLHKLITQLKLNDRVRLMGYVKSEEIKYSNYRYYIQTSYYESFGLSVAEAILHGLLCIVSDVGGMRDLVVNENFRFENNNLEDLTKTIKNAISFDEETYIRESLVNINYIKKKYSIDTMISGLKRIYEEAVIERQ